MSKTTKGHGFGTAPVFLAAISTILGAVLFLRFGYAVGNAGVFGAFMLILMGHAITIPTAMAVSEIATNLKVEGGGEYYIISRSFGTTVGGSIGIWLYFSQAISVAFYMIAFSEAFRPVLSMITPYIGFTPDPRIVGIPATLILLFFILWKGADIGVTMLWIVASILAVSLAMFFLGKPIMPLAELNLSARIQNPDNFFKVFAIIFPAFTGMTAGVGLSGDLKKPGRSIPLGTMVGTLTGMVFLCPHSHKNGDVSDTGRSGERPVYYEPYCTVGTGYLYRTRCGNAFFCHRFYSCRATDNAGSCF